MGAAKFPRSADGFLDALGGIEAGTPESARDELLRRALRHRSNHVVARAAAIIARLELRSLEGEVEDAFDRLLVAGFEADRGCAAKGALVGVLQRLELGRADLFRRGARHVQLEPVYGGREDTAAMVRSECGMALLRVNPWDFALELARLLADPEARVRENAARALGASGHPAAAPLLLHRVLAGEAEPIVTGECLRGLLALDAATHLETVQGFLEDREPTVRELAALALGESRQAEALGGLRRYFERAGAPSERRSALLAIGTLRCEAGFAVLDEVARTGEMGDALAAVEALRLSDRDPLVARLLAGIGDARPGLS